MFMFTSCLESLCDYYITRLRTISIIHLNALYHEKNIIILLMYFTSGVYDKFTSLTEATNTSPLNAFEDKGGVCCNASSLPVAICLCHTGWSGEAVQRSQSYGKPLGHMYECYKAATIMLVVH